MKVTGTGRIVLWGGGSIWIGRTAGNTEFHAHHAVQITLPLSDGEVRFRHPGGPWNAYPGTIIAAHKVHAFEAPDTLVAFIFAEPESREGRAIQQRCPDDGIAALSLEPLRAEIQSLAAAFGRGAADAELAAGARSVIALLAAGNPNPVVLPDARIGRALQLLRGRLDESVLLSDIAAAVHLSPDRFRHLFVEQTGIRFRPYVLWLRIELALARYVAGSSLTEASHAAGFADSAHLSRTFKRMFGVAPAGIRVENT